VRVVEDLIKFLPVKWVKILFDLKPSNSQCSSFGFDCEQVDENSFKDIPADVNKVILVKL